jgi:hypothetical protein
MKTEKAIIQNPHGMQAVDSGGVSAIDSSSVENEAMVMRLTNEHRIVYRIEDNAVLIAQLRYHY